MGKKKIKNTAKYSLWEKNTVSLQEITMPVNHLNSQQKVNFVPWIWLFREYELNQASSRGHNLRDNIALVILFIAVLSQGLPLCTVTRYITGD